MARKSGWKRVVRSRRRRREPDEEHRRLLEDYKRLKAFTACLMFGGIVSVDRTNPGCRKMALCENRIRELGEAEVEFRPLFPQNGTVMVVRMK